MAEPAASQLVVVRHACAGDKQTWRGDDAARPLDAGGLAQARALVPPLVAGGARRLVSSPTVRCAQTLEPLAARLAVEIERCAALDRDGSLLPWLAGDAPILAGAVLCTHGELMRPLLAELRATGVRIVADRADDDELLLSKGSAWRLVLDERRRITELQHVAPLPLPECGTHIAAS